MSIGIVMLAHTALHRAEQVARHWTKAGCPVVIHVDQVVPKKRFRIFAERLADDPLIRFSRRHHCDWGTWGLVAASQDASQLMLSEFEDVSHVYLTSGACLPLRPVEELIASLFMHQGIGRVFEGVILHDDRSRAYSLPVRKPEHTGRSGTPSCFSVVWGSLKPGRIAMMIGKNQCR